MTSRAAAIGAVLGGAALALAAGAQLAGWPTRAFALVALAGAVLTMIIGGRWPTRSSRYARGHPADDETAMWQAMDAGLDPTLDAGVDPTADAEHGDPDVHIHSSPDTMGNADQSQQSSRRE